MKKIDSQFSHLLREASKDPEVVLIFLREMWPRLAGERVARRSQPVEVVGKTLRVRVRDGRWRDELARPAVRKMLLQSINRFWGRRLIERIRVEERS